jgi:type III secretion protein U
LSGEKTEKPTPKKLRDAREKGQVAKSKEIATCAVIVGLFGYIWFFFDGYLQRLEYLVGSSAQYFDQPFEEALLNVTKTGIQEFILLTVPFALTAMVSPSSLT